MGDRFVLDPAFEATVLRSDRLKEVLAPKVDKVAEKARSLAPDDPHSSSDKLKDSITGDVIVKKGRIIGRVRAANFKAPWKEFGTVREHAKPFLRPAAEAEWGPLTATGDE